MTYTTYEIHSFERLDIDFKRNDRQDREIQYSFKKEAHNELKPVQ